MFGFLKNKLKEWVGKAKEKLEPEEKPEIKEETKPELAIKPEKKESKKQKKEKKKEAIIDVSDSKKSELAIQEIQPEIKPEEANIAVSSSEELELASEGVPQEIIDQELKQEIKEEKKGFIKKLFSKKKKQEEVIKEEIKEIKPIEQVEPDSQKKSFFSKIKSTFIYKITEEDFNSLFDDLEMLLLENNVALEVVEDIKLGLAKKLIGKEIKKDKLEDEIKTQLKNTLYELIIDPDDPLIAIKAKKQSGEPFVILFFGINGTGKTTSIAKIANMLKEKGISVVLAAADTFRAASIEQITEHATRLNVPLIKHDYQSDPAAVGFDAIKYAKTHHINVVLIDTAGRMHTKSNLLQEMEKICRVTNPDMKVFVAESIAGNDATEQAKTFNELIGIDGSILSKVDVDEKGGTIISVSHSTKKPIFYLGTGQKYQDIKLFDKDEYIKNLGL